MRVSVRLFAVLRERAGQEQISVDLEDERATVAALREALGRAVPAIAPLLPIVRVAVDESFADDDQRIEAGHTIALIPPVSGGSGLGLFAVREAPIALEEVVRAVEHPSAGAIATFSGTVRDATQGRAVVALEYEAYVSMAEKVLRTVGEEILTQFPGTRAAILHRVGRLGVGEVSVVIAVSSPHRADAFAGCRHAIERLKQDAPIWKKEIRSDGSVWVGLGS